MFKLLNPESKFTKNDLVAIKLHFGELGSHAFIKPIFVRKIVELVHSYGSKPFLTDTNTLYRGSRQNAVDHLNTAILHGFLPSVVNAPVIIADGLTSKDYVRVRIDQKHIKYAHIASAIYHANAFIALSHPTGHIATGYGGAIKNIGMGCGNRAGKQAMHADFKPRIKLDKCLGDGACARWCPAGAITVVNNKAELNKDRCIGCGECISSCSSGAITASWDTPLELLQEKIVEYAYAVLKDKVGKSAFFNFLLSITPDCDCPQWSDTPIVNDIGILSSIDPVALDQASIDLINAQPGNPNSRLKNTGLPANTDKFLALADIDYTIQLKYAEELGLGCRSYELIKI